MVAKERMAPSSGCYVVPGRVVAEELASSSWFLISMKGGGCGWWQPHCRASVCVAHF